jgi:ABC-type transporter Mla maintaining outer membrane lipid asymmetry ATPase subunit MlaF
VQTIQDNILENIEILKFDNISYSPDKLDLDLLKNISFTLKKGESAVIFGPEDSGIEIICPLIAGLVEGYQGEIYYKGRAIKTFNYLETHDYRKELGYLQREYGLISNMSVYENISLPLKYHSRLSSSEIEQLVNNYINEMNMSHCRDFRPVALTRSEKLKTAYLRSIVLDPDLILLEHSLESQCIFNVQTFLSALRKESVTKDKSVIYITYDPRLFFDMAERFIMLYKGNIVFEGSREDLSIIENKYLLQYFKSSSDGPMESR